MKATKSWHRKTIVWLCVVTSMSGCHKPYVMTEIDYSYYNSIHPQTVNSPTADAVQLSTETPRSVLDPTRKEDWSLSLEEVKRIALQNNKRIAFLGYEPGIQGTQIDVNLARFDAFVELGGQWAYSDQQVANRIQVFGTDQQNSPNPVVNSKTFGTSAGGNGSNSTDGSSTSDFPSTFPGQETFALYKRNVTGGLARVFYSADYQNFDPVSAFNTVNPIWRSTAGVRLEQPLLQGAGVEVNRAPILIARANHEQAIKTFEVEVQTLLRDVENAYWDLHFTYQDLYSREAGLEQALATWQKEKNREVVGTVAPANVAQAREQLEFFRAQRLVALNQVLNAERELRELMGLPPDDNKRIIPADEPSFAKFDPNWELAVQEAMQLRPDIEAQRFVVRAAELELVRQRNGLLPDLTVNASWSVSGLDDQLDQSVDRMTDLDFESWVLGVRYRRQIGERAANASVRRAQLSLSQEQGELRGLEHQALHELTEAYQNVISQYQLILAQKDRREAAAVQLEAREQVYRIGRETIDLLLQAQTTFANALRDESQAIVDYNKALIQWEFARGQVLSNDNVVLAEQRISLSSDKLRRDRIRWMNCSVPIRLHPGTRVHGEPPCPPDTAPLYKDELWESLTPPSEEASLPAEEATISAPEKPGEWSPAAAPAPSAAPINSTEPAPASP